MSSPSKSRGATNVPRFGTSIAFSTTSCILSIGAFLLGMSPDQSLACACGCGVFEVGTSSMLPAGEGGMAFLEYDFQNQNRNWSGSSAAPSANNSDKDLRTSFFTPGVQYMFDRSWGVQVQVPVWDRYFKTDVNPNFPSPPPDIVSTQWVDFGDARLKGIYTGFSEDLSTGITFGVKLPTGNFTFNPTVVDRDSQIGSGSTDILLGAFQRGMLTSDNSWSWFAQAQLDQPVLTQQDYRPGSEVDVAAGVHYNGWSLGGATISPLTQVIVSERTRDSGSASASPVASGYQRLLLSPGIEVDADPVMVYADVEVPVYAHVTGNQLVAPVLFKLIAAYMF